MYVCLYKLVLAYGICVCVCVCVRFASVERDTVYRSPHPYTTCAGSLSRIYPACWLGMLHSSSDGGPGASSLFGLLTELGPLLLNDGSLQTESYRATGIPTLLYNPHAWTRLGHVLAFDQPAPVGFSYCNNNSSSRSSSSREGEDNPHSCGGLAWTDELTAQAAHAALLGFYEIFPQYQTNALYLTGESYAGIYIPTLAREIVARNSAEAFHHHNNNNNTVFEGSSSTRNRKRINLVGFAVGDGCLGTQTGICGNINPDDKDRLPFDVWNILFLFGHGQLPMQTFNEVMQACYDPNTNDVWWKTTESGEPERLGISQSVLRHLAAAKPSTTTSTTTTSSTMKQQTSHVAERDDASCQASLQKVNQQVGGVYAYGYVCTSVGYWQPLICDFWC